MKRLLVTGCLLLVKGNPLCQFIRHCEETRRSNLLIILLNGLLLPQNRRDRNDNSSMYFRHPSNYSILTTPY